MDETKLFKTIRDCTETYHFCLKGIAMPTDVPAFADLFFLHLFPFRNYDEWATSALKQQYDRGSEEACNQMKALLERCRPSNMELDLRKYTKVELAKFKRGVAQRMREKREKHVFLLYHHRELHQILYKLSGFYGIPRLPGSNLRLKGRRPEGTCDNETLHMFHDCFSQQLMEGS